MRPRVRAGWARDDVIGRLAAGVDPRADALLQSRADRLVRPASRARIAAGLERIVAAVDAPASAGVAARRELVSGARHELMRLAGELRHMPDPRPRGVAMAERLLRDRSSPLYTASSSGEIARAARDAADSMRPS
jgi:phage terminase large subunit-like protein